MAKELVILVTAIATVFAGSAFAAVSAAEAKQLGGADGQSLFVMDLLTGIWTGQGTMGTEGGAWYPSPKLKNEIFYSPEALAGEGVR